MLKVLLFDDGSATAPLLREAAETAGCVIVGEVRSALRLPEAVQRLAPDAVLIDIGSPGRDVLEQIVITTRDEPRPILMFTADGSDAAIEAALQAGVSAYVVDGIDSARLRSILRVAITRFRVDRGLREKLDAAEQRLAERRLIDRAKGLVMQHHRLGEDEAYHRLRRIAMQRGVRLVDVAREIVRATEGKP